MSLVPEGWAPGLVSAHAHERGEAEYAGEGHTLHPATWSVAEYEPNDAPRRCTATTKKGEPCKAPAAEGTKLCFGHIKAAEAAKAREEG